MAASTYHRRRGHFEHVTTRWILGLTDYPEDTSAVNLGLKELTWD
ncbi:hypothetical protein ACIRQP_14370 [Streptomyces sp. NPDC102274]